MQSREPAAVSAGIAAIERGVRISINSIEDAASPIHAPRDHVNTAHKSIESAQNPETNLSRLFLPSTTAARAKGNARIIKYPRVLGLENSEVLRPDISENISMSSQS